MDFSRVRLTAEQEAFEAEVRGVLEKHWTPDPNAISLDHDRPSTELIGELVARGWVHPREPKDRGGADLGPVEARVLELLLEEYHVPPYTNELVLPTLRKYGSDRLKSEVLPDLESGRTSFCLGYTEPDSGSDMASVRTHAVRQGDDWVINGSKMFTTWAHQSDFVFLLTRTGPVENKHRNLTVFLVPMHTEGVEVGPIYGMGDERTNVTYYRDVRVPDYLRLGAIDAGWQVVSEPLAAEHGLSDLDALADYNGSLGASNVRVLEHLLLRTAQWAAATADEDGRPLIEDRNVRRQLATMLLDIEVNRNTPSQFGKVRGSETLALHADAIADLTAPVGVLHSEAPGSVASGLIGWARLFAPGTAIYGGTTEIYRNNIARADLGLPRAR
ncbi:MAG TPA: acyl-CoA dehydrogenase family protein [Kineosporiaceae bacterium]